ncbi:MAG TPA: VWA domain-containing protein [Bryobacteraceae bacterium]|nr:VWA domain-containing protein [Bryobacteraceae bacterium]
MVRKDSKIRAGGVITLAAFSLALFPACRAVVGQAARQSAGASAAASTSAGSTVSVDFVARDKKGERITDLKAEDIEILDGGARVQVSEMRRVAGAAAPGHSEDVVLLFDQLEPGNAKNAHDAAFEILKATVESDIIFTVLKVDTRLHLLQAPVADRETVKRAIIAATTGKPEEYRAQNAGAEGALTDGTKGGPGQETAQALYAMLLDSQTAASDPHITPSIAGLSAVCRAKQKAPGRKALVYFSQGLDWNLSAPESLRSIVELANRSRVSIYSLDAHVVDTQTANELQATAAIARQSAAGNTGISAGAGPQVPDAGSRTGGALLGTIVGEQSSRFEQNDLGLQKAPLEAICFRTGGGHEVAGNARKSTRLIVDDLTSYYVASYIPPSQAEEGRFRPASIKSQRPGIAVSVRAGYYVPLRAVRPLEAALESRLLKTFEAPKLPEDLKFRSGLLRYGDAGSGAMNAVVMEAPLNEVEFRTDDATKSYVARLAVVALLKDKTGAVVEKFNEDVSRQGPAQDMDQAKRDVAVVKRYFTVAPGQYVLETVMMDQQSGKVGSRHQDVVVLAPPTGLSLSDIVLVRKMNPFSGDEDTDRSDPLRCAEGRVVPNLSGRVSKAAQPTVALFLHVYLDRSSSEKPSLKAEVRRAGGLIATVPMPLGEGTSQGFIPYIAQLGTTALDPGWYTLTLILEQGTRHASQSVSFTLE